MFNSWYPLLVLQERPRPTFAALAPAVERNPVTGLLEPYFPEERRFPRVVAGIAVLFTMVRGIRLLFSLENLQIHMRQMCMNSVFCAFWLAPQSRIVSRKIHCSSSFALHLAHVKFDVWNGPQCHSDLYDEFNSDAFYSDVVSVWPGRIMRLAGTAFNSQTMTIRFRRRCTVEFNATEKLLRSTKIIGVHFFHLRCPSWFCSWWVWSSTNWWLCIRCTRTPICSHTLLEWRPEQAPCLTWSSSWYSARWVLSNSPIISRAARAAERGWRYRFNVFFLCTGLWKDCVGVESLG